MMFNVRETALQHITYSVGANSNLLIWYDPVAKRKTLVNQSGTSIISLMDSSKMAMVDTLLSSKSWQNNYSNPCLAMAKEFRGSVDKHSL